MLFSNPLIASVTVNCVVCTFEYVVFVFGDRLMLGTVLSYVTLRPSIPIVVVTASPVFSAISLYPLTFTVNTPSGVLRKVLDKLNRNYLMKNATEFWACSRLAGEWLFGLSICSGNKFKLIYNAVDSSFFNYDMRNRKKIRKELNIDNKFVIGHVGRFCYQKNHDFLIRMFNLYLKTNPDSVLLLIGEGELKSSIKNIVDNFGINDKVLFLGTTNKVYEYLSVFDLFVLPSRFEGLPVVGIEAQAVGINCIFSDLISSELKINDNVVFSPLDEKIWVDKINCVKSLKLKDNNIHNNYDIFKESKKLEKEYFKLFYD